MKGIVVDDNENPVCNVNVSIKDSYDGSLTNSSGVFLFQTKQIGNQTLEISQFEKILFEKPIHLVSDSAYFFKIEVQNKVHKLNEVKITAGLYEVGDKKRGVQLEQLDIYTTANSNGDIYGVLTTLPGSQIVSEEGAMFVRGGEKNESKTFVDGFLVSKPYTSKVPDLPVRGRFSPSLFNGFSFSSGGYSAEYGQALSSALILETENYPEKSISSVQLYPYGVGANKIWKRDSSSIMFSIDYFNMKPYYSIVEQNRNWLKAPESLSTNIMLRKKLGRRGLIKTFSNLSGSRMGLVLNNNQSIQGNSNLQLDNNNAYVNSIYTCTLSHNWTLKSGAAINYDNENINYEHLKITTNNQVSNMKIALKNSFIKGLNFVVGSEVDYHKYEQSVAFTDSLKNHLMKFESPLYAFFVESNFSLTTRLSYRVGYRFEYSQLLNEFKASRRLGLAYKLNETSQISAAYGQFNQLPDVDFLKFSSDLKSEIATHYIVKYEYSANKRSFRIEGFWKEYDQLMKYQFLNDPNVTHYSSNGYGYACGIDFFVKDKTSIRDFDYWVTYSFLDTKKLYQNYTSLTQPNLFAKHNASFVGKYLLGRIHTQIGLTYQFASARPSYNPYQANKFYGYTPNYHNLSTNFSYLTHIRNWFTIVHFSASNILGFDNVNGYQFSKQPDTNGVYNVTSIKPSAKRFYVIGLFVTFDENHFQL